MKTLGRIKLNLLSKEELESRELRALVGGCSGQCCCRNLQDYPDNMSANYKGYLHVANGGYSEIQLGYGTLLPEINIYGNKP